MCIDTGASSVGEAALLPAAGLTGLAIKTLGVGHDLTAGLQGPFLGIRT